MNNTKHLEEVNRAIHAAGGFWPDASPDDYRVAAMQPMLDAEQAALLVVGLKPTPSLQWGRHSYGTDELVKVAVRKTSVFRVFENAPYLSPSMVIRIAQEAGIEPPKELADAIAKWAGSSSTGTSIRWTPEFKAEVQAFRGLHGTKKTAEKFGVSEQLIRSKLPSENFRSKGFSAFNQHKP